MKAKFKESAAYNIIRQASIIEIQVTGDSKPKGHLSSVVENNGLQKTKTPTGTKSPEGKASAPTGSEILRQVASEEQWQRAEEFMKQLPEERDKKYDDAWQTFGLFTTIARASGEEKEVSRFVENIAKKYQELGVSGEATVDKANNVIFTIPGNKLGAPKIILQGHLDMVCQTEDPNLDPAKVGVWPEVVIDEQKKKSGDPNWWKVRSKGGITTVGLDNGAMSGFILQLPLLLQDIPHGDIRLIFTTAEESNLTGAKEIDPKVFEGYSHLINIDMEEEKLITIGSAAIGDTYLTLPIQREKPAKNLAFKSIQVSGLEGGHSGLAIGDPSRQNAIKLSSRILSVVPNAQIASISADAKLLNAIQKDATIVVGVPQEDVAILEARVKTVFEDIKSHEKETAKIIIGDASASQSILTKESSQKAIAMLNRLPHGVSEWDPDDKETDLKKKVIQTSTNMATAVLTEDSTDLLVNFMSRSSFNENLEKMREDIAAIGRQFGAEAEQKEASPAWEPVRDTELSKTMQEVYKELYPDMPQMYELITHGGLETAHFVKKASRLKGNVVSIGPDIHGAHSVNEEMSGPSFERMLLLVLQLITRMSEK